MKIKLERNALESSQIFEPIKSIGESVQLAAITQQVLAGNTITSISVSSIGYDMKSGDRININGQLLTLSADASTGATSLSVNSTVLDYTLELHASIAIDTNNLFVQYQRKTEGTIAGMPVAADELGPITYKSSAYSIDSDIIIGVDLDYIKILPRDFVANDDVTGSALQFVDGTNTGMVVEDPSQEMVASIAIPYGKTATEVIIYSNNSSKTVDVYEMDIDANGLGTAIGTGTLNSVVDITDTVSTATNFLLIKVIVTSSNHRVWGGKVTLI